MTTFLFAVYGLAGWAVLGLFFYFVGDGELNGFDTASVPERSLSILIFYSLVIFLMSLTYGVWMNLPSALGAFNGVPKYLCLY